MWTFDLLTSCPRLLRVWYYTFMTVDECRADERQYNGELYAAMERHETTHMAYGSAPPTLQVTKSGFPTVARQT